MLKQNYTILLFTLFTLVLLVGCKSKVNKHIRSKIEKAIQIGEDQPNEALQILDSIQTVENLDEESFMLYQIAKVRAKRNANIKIKAEEAQLIAKAVEYFEKKKDTKNTAWANYYAGIAFEKTNNLPKGFSYYKKAYPYAKAANDSLLMAKSLYNVAIMCTYQELYDSTIVYLKEALPIVKNNPKLALQTYNKLAFMYYLKKDNDTALDYLAKSHFLFNNEKDKQYIFEYNNLSGIIFTSMSKYKEASSHLYKYLDAVDNNPREKLRATLNLAELYITSNEIDSATYYTNKAMPLLDNFTIQNIEDNYLVFYAYKVLRNYYIQTGNKDEIIKYALLHANKDKELDEVNVTQNFLRIDKQMAIDRINSTNKTLNIKILGYTILVFVLIFLVAIAIIHVRLKKNEEKTINKEIEKYNQLRKQLRAMRKD